MVKISIAVAVLTYICSAYARPREQVVFTADKCSYGPSFWCETLENARRCGAVDHCQREVWRKDRSSLSVRTKSNDMCKDCIKFVNTYKDFLLDKSTVLSLEDFIDNEFCSRLGPVANECNILVTQYVPLLLQMLYNEINATEICQLVHLCQGLNSRPLVFQSSNAGEFCQPCVNFVNQIRTILEDDKYMMAMEQYLIKRFCSGITAPICREAIEFAVPYIYKIFLNDLEPERVCHILGFCNQTELEARLSTPKRVPPPSNGVACKDCLKFIDVIKEYVSKNTTVGQLKTLLYLVCNYMGPAITECKAVVDEYAPVLLKMLTNALDSRKICSFLHLCPKNFSLAATNNVVLRIRDNVICDDCVKFFDMIRHDISSNTTAKTLEGVIDFYVCNLLLPVRSECRAAVHKYAQMILKMLSDAVDSKKICQLIKLCSSNGTAATIHKKRDYEFCFECNEILTFVKQLYDEGYFTDKVEHYLLDNYCDNSGPARNICTLFVKQTVPYFFSLLLRDLRPYETCQIIHLCKEGPSRIFERHHQKRINSFDKCKFCQVSLEIVQRIASDPILQKDLTVAVLNGVCPHLGKYATECKEYVNSFFPIIFEYLVNEMNPKSLCVTFHACTNGTRDTVSATPSAIKQELTARTGPICLACKYAVEKIDDVLKSRFTKV